MAGKAKQDLAPRREGESSAQVYAERTRNRARAAFDVVLEMLTGDPKKRRRDALGRDVFEVWADLVLANPGVELERAFKLFPQAAQQPEAALNIGALYLQAVQLVNTQQTEAAVPVIKVTPVREPEW